jgi:hypothetical protein
MSATRHRLLAAIDVMVERTDKLSLGSAGRELVRAMLADAIESAHHSDEASVQRKLAELEDLLWP